MAEQRTAIDAWMQHPGQRWVDDAMFASLRRWRPGPFSETAPPLEVTVETMDTAGVGRGMLCAWHGPAGVMISNEDVPFWPATDCLAGLDALELDEPTAQAFLHDNAARAFGLS